MLVVGAVEHVQHDDRRRRPRRCRRAQAARPASAAYRSTRQGSVERSGDTTYPREASSGCLGRRRVGVIGSAELRTPSLELEAARRHRAGSPIVPMGDHHQGRDAAGDAQARHLEQGHRSTHLSTASNSPISWIREEYFVLADLMYADSDALPKLPRQTRRKSTRTSFCRARGEFIYWGITEPFRALAYMLQAVRRTASRPRSGRRRGAVEDIDLVADAALKLVGNGKDRHCNCRSSQIKIHRNESGLTGPVR